MARSAHAYVRGNVAKFYDRVDASPGARRVTAWPAISIVGEAVKAGRYLAFVVGKAHARQMDDAVPQGWLAMLETIGAG
ncbi:hypothetical protein [Sphingomonas sp. Leaf38]|uniref:hypothetical protein n=1 Tax=Sphingomonas sp. Leaf38 TaxID=1736217 RepID=UPI0006FA15D3|nr:hypothetical protein [Sphingomonas sp. Leaf38]KQN29558.1 hypothetical protein ASE88_11710 [Sphingomonas sp. Leaf38]